MSWQCNLCETINTDDLLECEVCSSLVPRIISMNYSNVDITKPTTIVWESFECDKTIIVYNDVEHDVSDCKEYELIVLENSTVTFKVSNSTTTRFYSFPIHVGPPEIVKFEVNAPVVLEGQPIKLIWKTKNCNSVQIKGHGSQVLNGELCIEAAEKDIVLVAENPSGRVQNEIKIRILKKPHITFKLSKNKLRKGSSDKSKLEWEIENCNSAKLFINGEERGIKNNGIEYLSPSETTVLRFEVLALDKKTLLTKEFTLYVLPESEINFSIDKGYTFAGIPITLSWNVENALQTILDGEIVSANGCKTIIIDRETTFELTAIDEFGENKKTITARMLPLPIIKSIQVPAPAIEHTISLAQLESLPDVEVEINSQIDGIAELDADSIVGLTSQQVSICNMVELEYDIKNKTNRFINRIKKLWKKRKTTTK